MANTYTPGSPGVPDPMMPSEAAGSGIRRSSYASVVSGAAQAYPQPYQQPMRSGALSHFLHHPSDYNDRNQSFTGNSRYGSRSYDMDYTLGGSHGRSGSWGRGGQLPSFSSAFGSIAGGLNYGNSGVSGDNFLKPTYLKGSKYMQKLEEAHKTKISSQKDGVSAPSSQPGSLSTSASSIKMHAKIVPSHRGMTYDVIEKAPPAEDEVLPPLPSRWSNDDKHRGLEVISDGLEVKLTSVKASSERDHEACAVRADHPMPSQCGIYYYEVTIISRIGFSASKVQLTRLPGWEPDSWAYHGDDGFSFCCHSSGKTYGPTFQAGDIIGCGVNFRTGCVFFTKNGKNLGTAFREMNSIKEQLFPSVGMKKSGEHIRVNFGQAPFVFDIDGMMANEKQQIEQQIKITSTLGISPPLVETELIQKLVLQFLSHDGYVETARAFASEVSAEKQALNLDSNASVAGVNVKEDEDAKHRQRIRAAILDGDIDKALKYTNSFYPHVLKDNEHVSFRLKCRKFIEMIRQGAEIQNMQNYRASNGMKKSNGHSGDWYDDILNQEMELDDHHTQNNIWGPTGTDPPAENTMDYHRLLEETLNYGKDLQAEFEDDPRREVGNALREAFSLMAYQDPLNAREVSHLLDPSGRALVAEELNSAILLSLGKSSSAGLERVIQQTTVLLEDLRENGGPGAFVNIDDYIRPKP